MENRLKSHNNKKILGSKKNKFGILLMLIGSIFFSLMALIIKNLNHLPLMELIFFRNLPTFLILPWIIKIKGISIFGQNKLLLLLRSLFGFISMIGFVFTFMRMNTTDAMAIRQLSPFIIIFLSIVFLHEKVHSNQVVIFIFALIGSLLVIKPGFRSEMFPAVFGLTSVFFSALAHTILRRLRLTDDPVVIVNYYAFFSGIISFIILMIQNKFQLPNGNELLLLLFLGLISFFAQMAISYAFRFTPASVVSLYLYSRVLFTAILDFILFGELPDQLSIMGCVLITIGGFIHFRNKVKIERQEDGK